MAACIVARSHLLRKALLFKVADSVIVGVCEKVRQAVQFNGLFEVVHEARAVALVMARGGGRRRGSISVHQGEAVAERPCNAIWATRR